MGSCLGHCCIFKRDFRCRTIFSCLNAEQKRDTSLHLELLDDAWSINDECIDTANEGMLNLISSSQRLEENHFCATPSSLDLEWEHLPELEFTAYITDVEDKDQLVTTRSLSTCSHANSHDSLEWDPVAVGMADFVDTETEQLLQEIEILNSKVLLETQKWSR